MSKPARLCDEPYCGKVTAHGYELKDKWYCDDCYEQVLRRGNTPLEPFRKQLRKAIERRREALD